MYNWTGNPQSYAKEAFAESNAKPNGGQGGKGFAYQYQPNNGYSNGGGSGAGTTVVDSQRTGGGTLYKDIPAEVGTGGLLILYSDTLYNEGEISSNGSKGSTIYGNGGCSVGGAGSGAGSINIFARYVKQEGNTSVIGGEKGKANYVHGGDGGDGSYTINELGSRLNYPEKKITLNINNTYTIDQTKLTYTKLNEIQTEDLIVGNITYELTDDKGIISVDTNGNIRPSKLGTTKVKIVDQTNKTETYIIVEVTSGNTSSQIKAGDTFTLALKENGSVWTFGDNGAITTNEPTHLMVGVEQFKNIIDIGAGNKISIALNQNGEVYTWGNCYNGESINKINEPYKEETLSDIIAVDAKEDNFYGVDRSGNAYIWGKGYNEPTKIDSTIKYIDISGKILLGENGLVYDINEPQERINYLSNIGDISGGKTHDLFLELDGTVHSKGENDAGQLGNKTSEASENPVIVKTEDKYMENAVRISAGNKSGIISAQNRKGLCLWRKYKQKTWNRKRKNKLCKRNNKTSR